MLHGCILWEGGWDTSAVTSSSTEPNSRILIENPLTGIAGAKKSAESEFGEFTSMEKICSSTFD
jgi:hypothetical protein